MNFIAVNFYYGAERQTMDETIKQTETKNFTIGDA